VSWEQGWPIRVFWDQYNSNTIISNSKSNNTITIQYNHSIFFANTIPIQFQPFKSYFNTIHNTIHRQFQISSGTRRNNNMERNNYMTIISYTKCYTIVLSWSSWNWLSGTQRVGRLEYGQTEEEVATINWRLEKVVCCVFLVLIDTYYKYCVLFDSIWFLLIIVAVLVIGLLKKTPIQFQYNSVENKIWTIQYNTIHGLSKS
jgi:hypothetical protein